MLIAVDTSSRSAGVLLWKNERPLASLSWQSNFNLTAELTPAIQHMLQRTNIQARELQGVALALGPGGFSSLRVGMSVAKGLSLALDLPLFGTSTLEIEAYPYADLELPVFALLDAGRDEVAWACFQKQGGQWQKLQPEKIGNLADLVQTVTQRTIFCGEGLMVHGSSLRQALGQRGVIVEYPGPSLRLWALARLGAKRLEQGLMDDPATLQPLYLRRPSISKPKPARRIMP